MKGRKPCLCGFFSLMSLSEAVIERLWQAAPGLHRLALSVTPELSSLQAGQSLLVRPPFTPHYLREQWYAVERQQGQLIVERPASDFLAPGDILDVLGPVGTPFPWSASPHKRLLLVAEDTLPTPLLMLCGLALSIGAEVVFVLLGTATRYPAEALPKPVEVLTGDSATFWKQHPDLLLWGEQIFVVVADDFWEDRFSALFYYLKMARTKVAVNVVYGVLTSPLPCGVGACLGCMVRGKTGTRLLCTQGAALDLTDVLLS
jgi:hypothetical protein